MLSLCLGHYDRYVGFTWLAMGKVLHVAILKASLVLTSLRAAMGLCRYPSRKSTRMKNTSMTARMMRRRGAKRAAIAGPIAHGSVPGIH